MQMPAGMPNMGNMAEMMNNPMVKQFMENPDFMRQAASMMGGGGANPQAMQEMMQNPSLQGMMQNPEFLSNITKMLRDPKNKAMLDMMQAQNPNMNMGLLLKALGGVTMVVGWYQAMKRLWQNVVVRFIVFGLFVLLVAWYFG